MCTKVAKSPIHFIFLTTSDVLIGTYLKYAGQTKSVKPRSEDERSCKEPQDVSHEYSDLYAALHVHFYRITQEGDGRYPADVQRHSYRDYGHVPVCHQVVLCGGALLKEPIVNTYTTRGY